MTAFEGGRDEWPLEYQPLAITPPRRRVTATRRRVNWRRLAEGMADVAIIVAVAGLAYVALVATP